MIVLIDPPITPWSPPDQIQGWIAELERIRPEHEGDEEALGTVDYYLGLAREWLERADARGRRS